MFALKSKTIINSRLLAILFLGFSGGLPLSLTSATLQAWFTQANVNLATIGAISLIGIPYTLKFIWAPLMDYFTLPWLGMRRGWILLMQAALVTALLVLANMDPGSQALAMSVIALVIAFLSASQDVAIDAYRADILNPEERGLGAAYYIFAYRIALLVSGGLALVSADHIGWKLTYLILALILLLVMISTYKAPKPVEINKPSRDLFGTVSASLNDLLQRDKVILLFLFLILYKFGDALALQLMTNFLLHGLGFTLTEVGMAYKVVGFIATISGAFIGGIFLIRWNVFWALLVFGLAQAFSNLMFVVLAMVGKSFLLMAASIFIENFCSGLSTAALLVFMMSLCNHQFTASQFALLSAIASLGRVFLGPVAAFLVDHLGWVQFYTWSFALSFPGIVVLLYLKSEVLSYAPIAAE